MPGGNAPVEAAVEVWDVNWKAFCLFRACATQWHHVTLPGALLYTGLDYVAVEVVMRRLAPGADHDALFADVMWMEGQVLPILNEVRS